MMAWKIGLGATAVAIVLVMTLPVVAAAQSARQPAPQTPAGEVPAGESPPSDVSLEEVTVGDPTGSVAASPATGSGQPPWWVWPPVLFLLCIGLGIVAALAGVGGGVLFVPVVSALFPFHSQYVRGAGLLVALAGALAAAPRLTRLRLANIRLALLPSLVASVFAIIGARVGLALPENVIQISLGVVILLVVMLFIFAKRSESVTVREPDGLARVLGIGGEFDDPIAGPVQWTSRRTALGTALFVVVGFLAGMFGLGAGWANVPVLNLVMGVPLKIAAGTSGLILAMTGPAAIWVYFRQGAMMPLIAIPSAVGMMIGARFGARLLSNVRPAAVRIVVVTFLALAGLRSLIAGLLG